MSASSASGQCSTPTVRPTVASCICSSGEGRDWLEALELADAAREQVTVAIAMTEALNAQIAPLDRQLRLSARRQAG